MRSVYVAPIRSSSQAGESLLWEYLHAGAPTQVLSGYRTAM